MSRVKCSRKGQLLFSLVCIVFDCEAKKKKTNKQRLKPFLRDPPTHTVTWEKKNEERDKTIEEEFWGQKCLFEKLLAMSRAFIEKKKENEACFGYVESKKCYFGRVIRCECEGTWDLSIQRISKISAVFSSHRCCDRSKKVIRRYQSAEKKEKKM